MARGLTDLRIVTLGGGTGGFTVNSGLRIYPVHPTAICTVFDSGGSTGILRDEFGALPQGDIRRCMLALADDKDRSLRDMFNYRFANSNGTSTLSQHSFGNLMLLAAEQLWGPIEGIRRVSSVLGVHGEVLPISVDPAHLCAELSDRSCIEGESSIDTRGLNDERTIRRVWLNPSAFICREAADALLFADIIVIGPGDLYTSIIPNLLVGGVTEVLEKSKAKVVYVANLMTKWQETRDFTAAKFVEEMCVYGIGREKFDAVLLNTSPIPPDLLALYARKDKSTPVLFDDADTTAVEELTGYTHSLIGKDLLSKAGLHQGLVRHDSAKLAKCIIELWGGYHGTLRSRS
ncbi:MAG: YvcK family protein [bacterium]|nr:YvcK family protein [bacterium]